jgi:hypothetical protein
MSELPKKMIVTSDLEKNLIFQRLKKMKEPLNITIDGIEYPGVIENFTDETITLKVMSPFIGEIGYNLNANFTFHNNYHYFNTNASQLDENRILLDFPEIINKNLIRKYKRINVLGKVFMKLKIMIQSASHDFETSSLLDERVIYQEAKKPRPAVEKILKGIKQLVSEYSQNFSPKVFKQGQKLSFEEQLIKETKKIFLIYDSFEDSMVERRFLDEEILTFGSALDYLIKKGNPRNIAESKLLDLLQEKRNQRIFSDCFVPLLLEGDTVGYIRFTNDVDYHRSIKPVYAMKAAGYADILVEALVKYDYFHLDSGKGYEIPVVNISAGGLLFKLEKPDLKHYIIKDTVVQMSISFPDRVVEARGVIYRIEEDALEYGVKFQEINELDWKYIEDIVKNKVSL